MDPLSELLASVRARTASWALLDARAPWGVALRGRPSTFCIHHVVSGTGWLSTENDGHALALTTGDVVVVPHGRAHSLRDRTDTPVVALEEMPGVRARGDDRVWHLNLGGVGTETRITSALVELEDPFSAPIMSSLPPVLRLAGAGAGQTLLVEHLRLLAREIESRPPGCDLVLARMADVLFVHVMRAYVETLSQSCQSLELVRALRDPGVATALGLMSRRPEHPWTVASLAEQVGLSRSAFAARFTSLVGEPPLGFLTRMRMQKATMLLREGATLALTSQLTGYASEASFSHAFRQWSGMAPGAYRRQQHAR
ncbi:AraC family transcriptional regulator [Polyangium aurulentum]|uniref:AraC family transcriptional regulator n=1 Tax=Polyangium aurulentum TaxID=2567896 RepID=UPI0010AE18EF|nr:AraC family transcriptional regulator [Polyangium aurulentum]UQA60495.1 AraC family transcriptional regulator [Polyangium aurulentum]